MPVSDVGRKGRRVDKDIPLLFQHRDSRSLLAHVRRRDTANVIAYLSAIDILLSYCSAPLQ